MASEGHAKKHLHLVFLPLPAAGHMLPMLDMARLFSSHGVRCTVLTTPSNVHKVSMGRTAGDVADGHAELELQLIDFPKELPAGSTGPRRSKHDDMMSITTLKEQFEFLVSLHLLRDSVADALRLIRPDALVSDAFFPWTTSLAAELGFPRLVFQGGCAFAQCATHSLAGLILANPERHAASDANEDGDAHDVFVLPGLPHRVELLPTQVYDHRALPQDFAKLMWDVWEAEIASYGVVVNSFYELEPDYADHYRQVNGRRTWHVGPVSLCNNDLSDGRPSLSAADHQGDIFKWLDSNSPGSVLYICFGSLAYVSPEQLMEIALSLESTRRPFIWVVRHVVDGAGQEWLERAAASGKGLIVRDWAPQVAVLGHTSVGGFMTHCGWNSTLESIAAGVPMATWPLFADQFYNERLIVDVLGVGVPVGSKHFTTRLEGKAVLPAARITLAVDELMGGGEKAQDRCREVMDLAEAARKALRKGGSSYEDMSRLMSELSRI